MNDIQQQVDAVTTERNVGRAPDDDRRRELTMTTHMMEGQTDERRETDGESDGRVKVIGF